MPDPTRREFLATTAGAAAAMVLVPRLAPAAVRSAAGPVSIGLIGAGRQGRAILGELQKLEAAKVAAVCDSEDSRLQSGLRRVQGAEGFADYRALLERKDVQAVFVATPSHLHRQIALDAVQAGKHVYCEAPLATTLEDCRAIEQAASRARTLFQVGLEARSNPIYQLARTFFRSDSVRDLVMIRSQFAQKTSWRVPSADAAKDREMNWRLDPEVSIGLAGEQGTLQFDAVHWYLNAYPKLVRGHGSVRVHRDGRTVHDTIHCDLIFPDGAVMTYGATLGSSFEGRHEVFFGSNATIKLAWTAGWMFKEADAPTQGWEVYANRQQFHADEGITLIADATKLAAQGRLKEGVLLPNTPLWYAINDFLRSITEGTPVVCNALEGLRAAAVGIAANRAVVSGAEVAIDEADLRGS